MINLVIHVLAALTLFGLVRRTLQQARHREHYSTLTAISLAGAIALLWALHPLQTEAVTYIVQRAESLMALCYLLTLYCFVRSVETTNPVIWRWLAVIVCFLGMACKEVMVSAPLLVLFYDRAFVSGSFREAWQCHGRMYLGLSASWLLLACLMIDTRQILAGDLTAVGDAFQRELAWRYPIAFVSGIFLVLALILAGIAVLVSFVG